MKKIYYLKTCDTCRRLMNQFDFSEFELHEIKTKSITIEQLEEMHSQAGSYENLFSKRAKKYSELGLRNKNLTEEKIKDFILNDYTFLKRPVIIAKTKVFIGSDKKNLEILKKYYKKSEQ